MTLTAWHWFVFFRCVRSIFSWLWPWWKWRKLWIGTLRLVLMMGAADGVSVAEGRPTVGLRPGRKSNIGCGAAGANWTCRKLRRERRLLGWWYWVLRRISTKCSKLLSQDTDYIFHRKLTWLKTVSCRWLAAFTCKYVERCSLQLLSKNFAPAKADVALSLPIAYEGKTHKLALLVSNTCMIVCNCSCWLELPYPKIWGGDPRGIAPPPQLAGEEMVGDG